VSSFRCETKNAPPDEWRSVYEFKGCKF
jgi:hypothetical protein